MQILTRFAAYSAACFTKEGWIKWESDEQWDSWGKSEAEDSESEKNDNQESEEVCNLDSFKDSNNL